MQQNSRYGYVKIDKPVQNNREKGFFYDLVHMVGLLGTVLVVQSDSSRKEGPAITLFCTLGVYKPVAEGADQC